MTSDHFVRHYEAVADASPVPVLLYNVTVFTGVILPLDAVREAGGAPEHHRHEGVRARPRAAGAGTSRRRRRDSPCSAARTRRSTRPCASARAGACWRWPASSPISARSSSSWPTRGATRRRSRCSGGSIRFCDIAGARFGVAGLKAAAEIAGYAAGPPRAPLQPASPQTVALIRRAVRGTADIRMTTLPSTERLLLGPGPSPVPPRVMRAMMAPVLGHLDPALLDLMDDVRAALGADLSRAGGLARAGGVGHRHLRDGGGGREPRGAGHARRVGRQRLLRRAARGHGHPLRRRGAARGRGVGARDRCRRGAGARSRTAAPISWPSCTPRRRRACRTPCGRSLPPPGRTTRSCSWMP